MIDVVTFGETMVSLRSAGPLTVPGTLTARIAGAESTVAIGLARLGHEVRWVSRVGDDAYGSVLLRTLRGERVDVSGVEVDPARPTGLMIAAARTADTTAVTYYRAGSAASAIDVLGAGDAFTAGYLSGVLEDLSPVERLVRGTKVAAFCVSTAGDYEGLPTRAELDGLQLSEVVTLR